MNVFVPGVIQLLGYDEVTVSFTNVKQCGCLRVIYKFEHHISKAITIDLIPLIHRHRD